MPRKSMDWFLYDNDLRHERVKKEVLELFLFSILLRFHAILSVH